MFLWARDFEEVFKVCNLFNLTELNNPKKFSYKSLKGYIQEGPQCGLVALAMVCEQSNPEFIQNLLLIAKKKEFTFNGEIFSSSYMESLAKTFVSSSRIRQFKGILDCHEIKEHLLDGGTILVPYDCDKGNYPGFYNGHKAHWAVLCGAIETDENFYVIARHGKARNVGIWELKELSKSNAQLNEFSVEREQSDLLYKVPDGGLNGVMGLKNTAVLIGGL